MTAEKIYNIFRRIAPMTVLVILVSCLSCRKRQPASGPSYKLKPGQVITYEGRSKSREGKNSYETTSKAQIWVVKQNEDSTWRLIARNEFGFKSNGNAHEVSNLVTLDLNLDGRIKSVENPDFRNVARSCFIALPPDPNTLRTTWEAFDKEQDERHIYTFSPRSKPHKGRWVFQEVTTSQMNEIYGIRRSSVVHFNANKGLVEKIELSFSQTNGATSKGQGTIKLKNIKMVDQDFVNKLSLNVQTYFSAIKEYREVLSSLAEHAGAVDTQLSKAKSIMLSAGNKVTNPIVAERLSEMLVQHDERISYIKRQAEQQGSVLNQPSPDWKTVDFEGRTYSIKALLGKVVVLDFWYRGCGWCIRAMPQIKQVADYFPNQLVVVLGMNIDDNSADAEFVIEEMDLNYPNLKAKGIPQKYSVRGYPTLIVIDQNSVVRSFQVGYSPDLRDDVIRTVEKLLNPELEELSETPKQ